MKNLKIKLVPKCRVNSGNIFMTIYRFVLILQWCRYQKFGPFGSPLAKIPNFYLQGSKIQKHAKIYNFSSKHNLLKKFWVGCSKIIPWVSIISCLFTISWKCNQAMPAQYENYENLLSHFFDKNFMKATFLQKKLLKSWFLEIFFRWEWISRFSTLCSVWRGEFDAKNPVGGLLMWKSSH